MRGVILMLTLCATARAQDITGVGATQLAAYSVTTGAASVGVQVTGSWSGTLVYEASFDSVTWSQAYLNDGGGVTFSSFTTNGLFHAPVMSIPYVRVRASSWTSGTATVSFRSGAGLGGIMTMVPTGSPVPVDTSRSTGTVNFTQLSGSGLPTSQFGEPVLPSQDRGNMQLLQQILVELQRLNTRMYLIHATMTQPGQVPDAQQ